MALDITVMNRITVEEATGKKPKKKDTREESKFRKEVKKSIKQMKKDGIALQIPNE